MINFCARNSVTYYLLYSCIGHSRVNKWHHFCRHIFVHNFRHKCCQDILHYSPHLCILAHKCKFHLWVNTARCSCNYNDFDSLSHTYKTDKVWYKYRHPILVYKYTFQSMDDTFLYCHSHTRKPGNVYKYSIYFIILKKHRRKVNIALSILLHTFVQLGPQNSFWQTRLLHFSPIQPELQVQVPSIGEQIAPFSQLQLLVQFKPNVPSVQIFKHCKRFSSSKLFVICI